MLLNAIELNQSYQSKKQVPVLLCLLLYLSAGSHLA